LFQERDRFAHHAARTEIIPSFVKSATEASCCLNGFKAAHGIISLFDACQVPEKLNIKVRVNKGQLAGHDLWHSDQATVDLTLRVAGLDYKN
jgi:hypothetical protein